MNRVTRAEIPWAGGRNKKAQGRPAPSIKVPQSSRCGGHRASAENGAIVPIPIAAVTTEVGQRPIQDGPLPSLLVTRRGDTYRHPQRRALMRLDAPLRKSPHNVTSSSFGFAHATRVNIYGLDHEAINQTGMVGCSEEPISVRMANAPPEASEKMEMWKMLGFADTAGCPGFALRNDHETP